MCGSSSAVSNRALGMMVFAGQSNGDVPHMGDDYSSVRTHACVNVAVGGTMVSSYWSSGQTGFLALKSRIDIQTAFAPSAPIKILWCQGEGEATAEGTAATYGSYMVAFADALESQTGRSDIIWIDVLLGTAVNPVSLPAFATVNTQKTTVFHPTRSGRIIVRNPDSYAGGYSDGIHYDATRRAAATADWYAQW